MKINIDNIKVSIIVPVYNVEKYLSECLDSAINQSLHEIEIICINDGSTDNSLNILKEYSHKYNNIKIINQQNKGLSGARNSGLDVAKGKYVYFLDSDDYIDLNAMKICYEEAIKSNLDIVTFDAECFYDKDYKGKDINEEYNRSKLKELNIISGKRFYVESNIRGSYRAPVWLNFYRTSFIKANNLYFEEGVLHEDEIHTCQALLKASRVKYIENKLFKRRIRSNSIMTARPSVKRIDGNIVVTQRIYELYLENKDFKDEELLSALIYNINLSIKRSLWICDHLQNYRKRMEAINSFTKMRKIINIDSDILMNKPQLQYKNNQRSV